MSYILDALRRAEAERQRGQVPGLGAQTTPAAADSDAPRRLPVAAWVAAALLAGVALLALGWWLRPPAPASTGVAPPVAVSAPAAAP